MNAPVTAPPPPAASAAPRSMPCSPISACRRWRTPTCRPSSANGMEPLLPAARARLRRVLPRPARGVRDARTQIFSDYAYFSSYSSSWLEHSRRYAEQMIERLGLDGDSHVVEIASNDGYLLQFFHERQIPVLGIEPAANVAKVALQKGIPTLVEFFGRETAQLAGARVRGRPAARQQRARPRPRPQRLRRRHEDPAQARRRDHDGVPAPDAPDRRQPVGHDLPRALLLLLLPHRQPRLRRPTACACSTSRSCPRTAARCASTAAMTRTRDKPSTDAARAARASASARRGYEQLGHLPRLRPPRRGRTSARSSSFLIGAQAAGPAHRRLRRAGQGQHAAQLLRRPARLHRLHLRSEPAQAGPLPAGQPHPDPLAGVRSAKTSPTSC